MKNAPLQKFNKMRCNNCGWDNKNESSRCEKCNYPLDGSLNMHESGKSDEISEPDKETIRGRKADQVPWDVSKVSQPSKDIQYRADEDLPESSKAVLSHFHPQKKDLVESVKKSSSLNDADSKTINPFEQPAVQKTKDEPMIRLRRIDQVSGKEAILKEVQAEDGKLVINRSLIDAANNTISQNEHAKLYFVEGKCFVKNTNLHGATFLRIGELTELKKGDCLLVGNELVIIDWE